MFKPLPKILLALIFWGVFGYVVFYIDYPKSITQANFSQLIFFFLPLFLSLIFTISIFLNLLYSIFISSGMILLLLLKALDILNFVTVSLIIISLALLLSYFHKIRLLKKSGKSKLSPLKKL